MPDNPQFDAAYWAHQDPRVQALQTTGNRYVLTQSLMQQGFQIDVAIMVWGWDPWLIMNDRLNFGEKWTPVAGQPNISLGIAGPAGPNPPYAPYDPNTPPPGAIINSIDLADYPPFNPPEPTPPTPPPTTDFVGNQNFGNIYTALPGDPTLDGVQVKDARGEFLKHRVQTPFGFNQWYEKLS